MIDWLYECEHPNLTITVGKSLCCVAVLDITNIAVVEDYLNIMVGDMDIYVRIEDFKVESDRMWLDQGNVIIELTR